MPVFPTVRANHFDEQPGGSGDFNRRKAQAQQQRQLLSCTKCRERKVKCDRTKPCTACCARGAPKECHFVAEGGDYAPIQQSYELKKLRAENLRLKERLRASHISIEDENEDLTGSPESQMGERPTSSQKRRVAKQRRFQGSEWQDSIYFGSPGLASVIHDFASMNIDPAVNLSHVAPRGPSMYTPRNAPPHPFATLFPATPEECIPHLLSCLPSRTELLECFRIFDGSVSLSSFPYVPIEITRSEVERFLSEAEKNAHLCPDMLALLFAALALGAQYSIWEKAGGRWDDEVVRTELRKGDVYIAAAMQALRLASFMHRPSLLAIQTLITIGPYLTNSGRFLDAWTLFGTTIRLAQAIGLHRHPKHLDPSPPTQKECSIRQTLWWWMLHMDEQYSVTLGRPLGISGVGDCPWPHELTTDPTMLRLGEFVNHFTVLARNILSSKKMTTSKIDDFTDALRALIDTMPEILQFNTSWIRDDMESSDLSLRLAATVYFCRVQTYVILLNRQRAERFSMSTYTPTSTSSTMPFRAINEALSSHSSPTSSAHVPVRGRAAVLASSEVILAAFLFIYHKQPSALMDWTLGQQAFNGCMILLFDAIETGRISPAIVRVEKAFVIFKELDDNEVHKLASLAVERISWGLTELHKIISQTSAGDITPREDHHGTFSVRKHKHEASYKSELSDAVMGNTGMMLLEDPGLQSFHHESFPPIRWDASRHSIGSAKGEGYPPTTKQHMTARTEMEKGKDDFSYARSTLDLQGTRRSPTTRSASTRYTTPLGDDRQSYGHTAPTSPVPGITQKARPERAANTGYEAHVHQKQPYMHPPHLQQLHAHVTADLHNSGVDREQSESRSDSSGRPTAVVPQQAAYGPSRHNSCPSLAHNTDDAPVLRPAYSSPSDVTAPSMTRKRMNPPFEGGMQPSRVLEHASLQSAPVMQQHASNHFGVGDSGARPPFAARAFGLMTSIAETVPSVSSSPGHSYVSSEYDRSLLQQQQQQQQQRQQPMGGYSMPPQYQDTGPALRTQPAEEMRADEWRSFVGFSRPG
ncbi:hypothetical protein ACN47E_008202 [Coniothyrium glycines]